MKLQKSLKIAPIWLVLVSFLIASNGPLHIEETNLESR